MESALSATTARVCFTVPGVCVWKLQQDHKELLQQGPLSVLFVSGNDGDLSYLSCGTFAYPLVSGCPAMRVAPGFYVFPLDDDSHLGLSFEDVSESMLAQFEDFLQDVCSGDDVCAEETAVLPSAPVMEQSSSMKVAAALLEGSAVLATGILRAAVSLGNGLRQGGEMMTTKLSKSDSVTVSESTKRRLRQAKYATGVAVTVSKSIVEGLVSTSCALGKSVASFLSSSSSSKSHMVTDAAMLYVSPKTRLALLLLSQFVNSNAAASLKTIGAAGVTAAVTVWAALEDAGQILLKDAAAATTCVIEHKYGEEAGTCSRDAAAIVTNAFMLSKASKYFGPKALLKRTATSAATEYFECRRVEAQVTPMPSEPLALMAAAAN